VSIPRYSLIALFLLLFHSIAYAQGSWPTFGQNPQHTGLSPYVGPQTAAVKWSYAPAIGYFYGLSVGPDDTVYATAPTSLYAIDNEGFLKWTFATSPLVSYGDPAVGTDGTIYLGIDDVANGSLCAVNPDGTLKWLSPIGSAPSLSSPVISSDGSIYVGTYSGDLVAFTSNGVRKWRFSIGGSLSQTPAIGFDGTIYVTSRILPSSSLNGLYAINPQGTLKWRVDMSPTSTSPTIGSDGTIYVTVPGEVLAVNSNGTLKWSRLMPAQLLTSPSVGSDGTLYVGSNTRVLSALDSNGSLLWDFTNLVQSGGMNVGPPPIGADGTIYTTGPTGISESGGGNSLFAIKRDGSLRWTTQLGLTTATQPILGANGLYISAILGLNYEGGLLYSLGNPVPPSVVPRPPTLSSLYPPSVTQGQVQNSILTGTNFIEGDASVTVSGQGITVDSVRVRSSEMLTVTFTVSPDAVPGSRAVSVITQAGTSRPLSLWIGCSTCGSPFFKTDIQPFRINASGGVVLSTLGAAADIATGYAGIEIAVGDARPSGVQVLQYRAGTSNAPTGPATVLVSEAGISAPRPLTSGILQTELTASTSTALAMVNPSSTDASITFKFTDEAGHEYGNGQFVIPAFQHTSAYLNEPPFNGSVSPNSTFTFSSTVPLFSVALRFVTNLRGEPLMMSVPIFDLSIPPKTDPVVLSQFADGSGWSSIVILTNPTTSTISGTIQFRDASGLLTAITVAGQQQSAFSYSIPGKSSFRLATSGTALEVSSGSVLITPASGGAAPAAFAVLSRQQGSLMIAQTSITSFVGLASRMFVESSGDRRVRTAMTIANPSPNPAVVNLELSTLGGVSVQSQSVNIPAFARLAEFTDEVFDSLSGKTFQGVLRISSQQSSLGVAGFRTTVNERGDFLITAVDPTDENASATNSPIVFPQIVDGLGYTTDFILWNNSLTPIFGYLTTFSRSEVHIHAFKP
jgi:outer membrane protein assembly factor BamB